MSKEVEFINGITIPRKLYNRIENLAVSLLIKHNIRNLPIDPFALAVLENFVLRPYSSLPGEAIKMLLINAQDGFSYYDPHANKTAQSLLSFPYPQAVSNRRAYRGIGCCSCAYCNQDRSTRSGALQGLSAQRRSAF